jgi:hypothetical protein
MIVVCLTHFVFVSNNNRFLITREPRSRQLPESHSLFICSGLVGCEPPKARRRRSNLIIHQPSALHGDDLSWAVLGLASSFMSCVSWYAPRFSRTRAPYLWKNRTCPRPFSLSGRVCAALQQRAGFFFSISREAFLCFWSPAARCGRLYVLS